MTVHIESVIPTWANVYYPAFYDSITSKENWCYTQSFSFPADPPEDPPIIIEGNVLCKTSFLSLTTKMEAWKNTNYQTSVTDIVPLISGVYALGTLFNLITNPPVATKTLADILNARDAYLLFKMNGFMASTLSRNDDYYNDFTILGVSAKLTADIAIVNTAGTSDKAAVTAAMPELYLSLKTLGARSAFETPTGPSLTNDEKMQKIFVELHYGNVYDVLNINTVLGLPNPLTN